MPRLNYSRVNYRTSTPDIVSKVIELRKQGYSWDALATRFGKTPNTLMSYVWKYKKSLAAKV